jgi:arginase
MGLAAACGEWDAGLGDTIAAERLVLAGVRDLDTGERELLERSAATVIGASTVETLVAVKNALDGVPVFIHLDLDVLEPEEFPAAVPAPGGLSSDKLYDLMEAVAEDSEVVGLEVTAFEAPSDPDELADAAETAMRVLDPVLDRIAADATE